MDIQIGGRKIPLRLSVYEALTIQEKIGCRVYETWDEVFGMEQDIETGEYTFGVVKDPEKQRKLGELIAIMGNAGLEEAGKEPDLTGKWILRRMKQSEIMVYTIAVMNAMNEELKSENGKEEQNGPEDVILAEENRKKEPGN